MIRALPFLGERHYLQGATLLECLLPHAGNPVRFSFKIEKAILSNTVEVSGDNGGHSAVLSFGGNALFVRKLPLSLPVQREEFDEQALTSRMEKQEDRFIMSMGDASPVRGMVAAFKHTLLKYYPVPRRPGHWAYVRLDAAFFPQSACCLSLEKVFYRDGMACCSVSFDNTFSATLYFVWANF